MTLPSADQILAGYAFLARRHGIVDRTISERGVRAALADAAVLADGDDATEPAAIFYAFARRPRITRGAWVELADVLADTQARSVGLAVTAGPGDLRALMVSVASRSADFAEVRAWFAARLTPRER